MRKGFKQGYFFTLDAILAMSVLSIGIFLLFSSFDEEVEIDQVTSYSTDLLSLLSETKIEGINNQYIGVNGDLWNKSYITDSSVTILQQIGIFYATGEYGIAENVTRNLTANTIYSQYNFEVWFDNRLIYPQGPSEAHNLSKSQTRQLFSDRKLVQGYLNPENGSLYGPYVAEVYVWQLE